MSNILNLSTEKSSCTLRIAPIQGRPLIVSLEYNNLFSVVKYIKQISIYFSIFLLHRYYQLRVAITQSILRITFRANSPTTNPSQKTFWAQGGIVESIKSQ